MMGSTLASSQVVCADDAICAFAPAPGAGPGTSFADFIGEDPEGTWQLCFADAAGGLKGLVDGATLSLETSTP